MAAENTSSEAHHLFRNLYLAQPLSFDVLSSAAIAHTAESSLPIQQAPHLATALSENFIEQQNRHFESFPERPTHWMQAQAQDSPWKQIHTDLSRAPRTHSPFNYDINPPTDPSPPLQDSRLSTYLAPTSAFTNLTKMDPPMYEQHSAYSFEEPFKSLGGGSDFFDTIKPEHPSLSPLSSLASMEIDTGSPPYGSNSSYGIPLDTTRPPPPEQMEDTTGEPYARLIYRALKGAPGHRMVLKDIYNWFEMYTDKARDPKSRGWQNSIRHNLSMNGAFKKVEQIAPSEDGKRNYVWVLEPSALAAGDVQSTTRYRKPGGHKKATRVDATFHRQRSGAKGGRASRSKHNRYRRSESYPYNGISTAIHRTQNSAQVPPKNRPPPLDEFTRCIGTYTGIEHGLPHTPAEILHDEASFHGLHCMGSPITHACSHAPKISPTPTLSSGSFTEQETHDFEDIAGCTDQSVGTTFFCNGLAEHTHNDFVDPFQMDWRNYNMQQDLQQMDPMLAACHRSG